MVHHRWAPFERHESKVSPRKWNNQGHQSVTHSAAELHAIHIIQPDIYSSILGLQQTHLREARRLSQARLQHLIRPRHLPSNHLKLQHTSAADKLARLCPGLILPNSLPTRIPQQSLHLAHNHRLPRSRIRPRPQQHSSHHPDQHRRFPLRHSPRTVYSRQRLPSQSLPERLAIHDRPLGRRQRHSR